MARKKRQAAKRKRVKHPAVGQLRGDAEGTSGSVAAKGSHPKKLYSPGEVVRASGISRQVLHNYTVLGLLRPAEVTRTGRRYYDERVFGRIGLIRRMLASGYRLGDLRETFTWED